MSTLFRSAYFLSIPVVLGAVFSNRMAARLTDVTPVHWATSIVLALVVFIIYTVDRLLDVQRHAANPATQPLTPRHRFHRQHAHQLWLAVAVAAALVLVLVFFLPGSVIRFGLLLGGICVVYVLSVFRLPARHPALLAKEPAVALLYSVGVWGSVWAQRPSVSVLEITEGLMFAGVAFQNLLLFSVMEQQELVVPEFSLASAWGEDRCDTILRWLTFAIVVAGIVLCVATRNAGSSVRFAQRSALMIALMSVTLYIIQRYPAYFGRNERYRWFGDAVFWMPALVL